MMPQFLLSESTVDVLAQVVLHFLWQGGLVWLAAACLLHVSPIRSTNARYAFFCALLTLLAICPLVTWRAMGGGPATKIQRESANEASDGAAFVEAEESTAESIDMQSYGVQSIIRPPDSRLRFAGAWLGWHRGLIVTAWLAGICFMATRLLLGAIGVCAVARRRKPISPEIAYLVERLSRQLVFRVPPGVHVVERISQAMAVGIFKPMVLLPASWISELPIEVLEAVVAHELAHLRRWDLPINFMQRVVETLLFFHPAVWWCSRRLRIEREMCCDDLAQATIGNRVVYAKALAYVAHQQRSIEESLLAAGIGGSKMVVFERICNVLGIVPRRHGRLYGPSCALIGAVVTSLAWIAVLASSESWHARNSDTNDEPKIAANADLGTPPEVANSRLPTDPIEQSTPLDEIAQASEPLTLKNLEFMSRWDLSLEEAIKTSTANAKAMRSMCGPHVSPPCKSCTDQQTPTFDSALSAHTNIELSLVEFEICVRNLVNDTEQAYWELAFAWRNLDTSQTALESARQTWKKIHLSYIVGTRGGEAKEEAQAREQFYQFKSQTQTLLNELFRAENRLRYVMGVSVNDGRLILPIDKPTVAKVEFDWRAVEEEALARSPELRRQKWRVKQQELQVIAAKELLQPPLDSNGSSYQLSLARERAKLQDDELNVCHQLADAIRQSELNYQLTQTNFNRTLAADRQVEAVQAAFEAETVTIDQLLEAQRRRAEAQTSYFRTLLDYQRAIIAVHLRKGSLL